MKCEDCRQDLIDHAFGELPAARDFDVSRHLSECAECALEFCRLRADLDGVSEACVESPGPAVAEALRERVAAEVASRPSWGRRLRAVVSRPVPAYGAVLAAAAPLLVWGGLQLLTPRSTPSRASIGPTVIEAYDAPTLVPVDANLL